MKGKTINIKIEDTDAYCIGCNKQENVKRLIIIYGNGRQGVMIDLCDDCMHKLKDILNKEVK